MNKKINNLLFTVWSTFLLYLLIPAVTHAEGSGFFDTSDGVFNGPESQPIKNFLLALAGVVTYVGPVVIAFGIIFFLLAKASDNIARQVTGIIMTIVGFLLLCAKTITSAALEASDFKDMTKIIINQIISGATYIGPVVALIGIAEIVLAFREGDAGAKVKGIMVTITGVALISARIIVALTGLEI